MVKLREGGGEGKGREGKERKERREQGREEGGRGRRSRIRGRMDEWITEGRMEGCFLFITRNFYSFFHICCAIVCPPSFLILLLSLLLPPPSHTPPPSFPSHLPPQCPVLVEQMIHSSMGTVGGKRLVCCSRDPGTLLPVCTLWTSRLNG